MGGSVVQSRLLQYDVGFDVPGDNASQLAVEIVWPDTTPVSPLVWFCLPGGGMNRHFYNLEGGDGDFSFAHQMAAEGFVSVLIDPPGIGDSDQPEDGFTLTPERIVSVLSRAYDKVCKDLQAGRVADALPAISELKTVGVGHSMGALLTVLQQAHAPKHSGLAVLGFGLDGLPEYLPEDVRELAADPEAVRPRLLPMAQQMFQSSYPEVGSGGGDDVYGKANAEKEAIQALAAARAKLLPLPALMAILPNNVAPEAATIDVPVYVAVGEHDLVSVPTSDAKTGFSASPSVQQQTLTGAGHSFFLFPARRQLFDGLAEWGRGLATKAH